MGVSVLCTEVTAESMQCPLTWAQLMLKSVGHWPPACHTLDAPRESDNSVTCTWTVGLHTLLLMWTRVLDVWKDAFIRNSASCKCCFQTRYNDHGLERAAAAGLEHRGSW